MTRLPNEVSVAGGEFSQAAPTGLRAARDSSVRSCQVSRPHADELIQFHIRAPSDISQVRDKPKLSPTSGCALASYPGTDSSCWRKTQ